MPTFTVQHPDGRTLELEGETPPTEAELDEIFKSVAAPEKSSIASEAGSIAGGSAAVTVPTVRMMLEELATNPNVAATGAKIGRVLGGLAPPIGGAIEGGPVGFLAGTAAAAKGAWAGGKTGWFTGKLAQQVASPLSKLAAIAEKYSLPVSALFAEGAAMKRLNDPKVIDALRKRIEEAQASRR